MTISIQNQFAFAVCQAHGAQLVSFQNSSGKEYLWQRDPAYWEECSPILFPYVGPVPKTVIIHGKHYAIPLHGFVKDTAFDIAAQGEDFVTLTTKATQETLAIYPYDFAFTATFRLTGPSLQVIYNVTNQGTDAMPFLIGGHPGFFCPMEDGEAFTDYVLHFEDENVADVSLNYPLFDNDAILFEHLRQRTVNLIHKQTKKGIRVDFPDYPSVAFWTPIKKDAPFLCVEPWCAGTLDQVPNTNLLEKKYAQSLAPLESRDYKFSITPCQ